MINKQPILLQINGISTEIGCYNHSKRMMDVVETFNVNGDKYTTKVIGLIALNILIKCTSDDGDIRYYIASNVHGQIEIRQLDDEEMGGTVGMDIGEWFNEAIQ